MTFGGEEGVAQDRQQDDGGDVLNATRTAKADRSLTNAGVVGQIFFQIFRDFPCTGIAILRYYKEAAMPKTTIRIYQESDGSVPLLEWLDEQPEKVQDKFTALIELLEERGYDLRRPMCDFLESGIYELRARYRNVNYRILYGFVGKNAVLLSHGCTKESEVPKKEIQRAIENLNKYMSCPDAHTYEAES